MPNMFHNDNQSITHPPTHIIVMTDNTTAINASKNETPYPVDPQDVENPGIPEFNSLPIEIKIVVADFLSFNDLWQLATTNSRHHDLVISKIPWLCHDCPNRIMLDNGGDSVPFRCGQCGHRFCDCCDDLPLIECEGCGDLYCEPCVVSSDARHCHSCGFFCNFCARKDVVPCHSCQIQTCKDCLSISACSICQEKLCEECVFQGRDDRCSNCKRIVCSVCKAQGKGSEECDFCGRVFCPNCSTSSSKCRTCERGYCSECARKWPESTTGPCAKGSCGMLHRQRRLASLANSGFVCS